MSVHTFQIWKYIRLKKCTVFSLFLSYVCVEDCSGDNPPISDVILLWKNIGNVYKNNKKRKHIVKISLPQRPTLYCFIVTISYIYIHMHFNWGDFSHKWWVSCFNLRRLLPTPWANGREFIWTCVPLMTLETMIGISTCYDNSIVRFYLLPTTINWCCHAILSQHT